MAFQSITRILMAVDRRADENALRRPEHGGGVG